jgi:hypothetical protein
MGLVNDMVRLNLISPGGGIGIFLMCGEYTSEMARFQKIPRHVRVFYSGCVKLRRKRFRLFWIQRKTSLEL